MNTKLPTLANDASSLPEAQETVQANTHSFQELLQQPVPAPQKVAGIAIGVIQAFNPQGNALLAIPALGIEGVTAQTMLPLDATQLGREVAIGFVDGNPTQPIVLGLIIQPSRPTISAVPELKIDGERVIIQAESELELRCGEAAILLTSDGNIQIRGTYITSHASATQRILGGAVSVN